MKSQHLLVAVFFVFSAILLAAQQKSDSASTVLALEEEWSDAYKRGDIKAMNALLSDDFIITVEDGATYGKAGYIAHIAGSSEHVTVAKNSDVKVRVHGNVVVVTGAYYEKGTTKGEAYEYHDRFTDVWEKSAGGWRLIASHYSPSGKE